jgi:hypothetical protein
MCPWFRGVGLPDFVLVTPSRGRHAQELPPGFRGELDIGARHGVVTAVDALGKAAYGCVLLDSMA